MFVDVYHVDEIEILTKMLFFFSFQFEIRKQALKV